MRPHLLHRLPTFIQDFTSTATLMIEPKIHFVLLFNHIIWSFQLLLILGDLTF